MVNGQHSALEDSSTNLRFLTFAEIDFRPLVCFFEGLLPSIFAGLAEPSMATEVFEMASVGSPATVQQESVLYFGTESNHSCSRPI